MTFPQNSKKIIHLDMDAFFASVEQRDYPEYRGKPIIVGGNSDGRGVVATCSYEARKFGVHSAMPAARAKKLCPEGIFVRPRMSAYKEASKHVMGILRTYTPLVEVVSVDEAYLDVTQNKLQVEDPVKLAGMIKQHIFAVTKLTSSAGVSVNMFLAKIASDYRKPDGLTVIGPEDVDGFLEDLPVRKIPGVGPKTETALIRAGIETCGDLRLKSMKELTAKFGKVGLSLYRRSRGEDTREIEPHSERSQISTEETFDKDTRSLSFLKQKLFEFSEEIFDVLEKKGKIGKTVVLKVKYHDFDQITRSKTLVKPPTCPEEIGDIALDLLKTKTEVGVKPIRLLGVGISGLQDPAQAELFKQGELF